MRTGDTIVYLVGGDPDQSLSVKCLLESYSCVVKKVEHDDIFIQAHSLRKSDVILLDMNGGGPSIFKLVDQFIGALTKSRILILADVASNLRFNDVFADCEIEILLHPVNPKRLVNAIMGQREPEYQ